MSGNNWQEEAMRRLRQMQQARGGAGMGGGGPPQIPKGSPALLAAGVLLVGGAYVFSNSLFNVDGGQRAIKYRRVNGVSKEIYSEGEQLPWGLSQEPVYDTDFQEVGKAGRNRR
jgi:prohibitin 2